jgi:hypothetical protein
MSRTASQKITLAKQKLVLNDLVITMHNDLAQPSTKQERIKIYQCIIESEKTILDIKRMEMSRDTNARLKELSKEKKKPS